MLAGIREILIISIPFYSPSFKRLLGDGSPFSVKFEYAELPSLDGLAKSSLLVRSNIPLLIFKSISFYINISYEYGYRSIPVSICCF